MRYSHQCLNPDPICNRQAGVSKSPQVHNVSSVSQALQVRIRKMNRIKLVQKISLTLKCILSCKCSFNVEGKRCCEFNVFCAVARKSTNFERGKMSERILFFPSSSLDNIVESAQFNTQQCKRTIKNSCGKFLE